MVRQGTSGSSLESSRLDTHGHRPESLVSFDTFDIPSHAPASRSGSRSSRGRTRLRKNRRDFGSLANPADFSAQRAARSTARSTLGTAPALYLASHLRVANHNPYQRGTTQCLLSIQIFQPAPADSSPAMASSVPTVTTSAVTVSSAPMATPRPTASSRAMVETQTHLSASRRVAARASAACLLAQPSEFDEEDSTTKEVPSQIDIKPFTRSGWVFGFPSSRCLTSQPGCLECIRTNTRSRGKICHAHSHDRGAQL